MDGLKIDSRKLAEHMKAKPDAPAAPAGTPAAAALLSGVAAAFAFLKQLPLDEYQAFVDQFFAEAKHAQALIPG